MEKNTGAVGAILFLSITVAAHADKTFVDKTGDLGLEFTNRVVVAWGDYDNDGWTDLYDGYTWRNNEGQGFTRLGHEQQFPGIHADYDNDGYLDRFCTTRTHGGQLHRNMSGNGEFTRHDFPSLPMRETRGHCWVDLNGDSYIDLYLGGGAGRSEVDAIFINNEGKNFAGTPHGPALYTRGVAACDYDEDHDMDVFASRYWFQANQLWNNDGSGNLTDVGGPAGVHGRGHTISCGWADFDNDGHFDIFACNFNHHDNRRQDDAKLYKNLGPEGSWKFQNTASLGGDQWQESFASCALADYDNDGDVDIFVTTVYPGDHARLFRNDGNWTFTNVTDAAGLGGIGSKRNYQAAWGDYDHDGNVDLVTDARMFQNQGNANHWVLVRLDGNGRTVNRAAIGAQVRMEVPELGVLVRQVEGGTGQGNQNDLILHFGLGKYDGEVDLKIIWPDGSAQIVTTKVDRMVDVTQH